MKTLWGILIIVVAMSIAAFLLLKPSTPAIPSPTLPVLTSPQAEQAVDFTASFTIITRGITRNFSAAMYHNRSPDAYIAASDPTIIHIKKKGTTWNDFFSSLPFKLTRDCLTTGTNETFCTGSEGTLRFYLDGVEDQNLLDREIQPGAHVLIEFFR